MCISAVKFVTVPKYSKVASSPGTPDFSIVRYVRANNGHVKHK